MIPVNTTKYEQNISDLSAMILEDPSNKAASVTLSDDVGEGSCYGVELTGVVVEQTRT